MEPRQQCPYPVASLSVMEEEVNRIDCNLPAMYLDIARSAFSPIHHYDDRDLESSAFQTAEHNTTLAVMAISIVFAYQAMEAMCNGFLEKIYSGKDPVECRKEELSRKRPNADTFEPIKREDLGCKIKLLADILCIKRPAEVDSILWNRFKQITEKARHFIIHPNPEEFQEMRKKIMEDYTAGEYVKVAQGVISHFYVETGTDVPLWITSSTYFTIKGFQLIEPKNRT